MMTEKAVGAAKGSPLRQRMIDQMRIANLAASTQSAYLFEVERMARHYGASPADFDAEQVRDFVRTLIDRGLSPSSTNSTLSALRLPQRPATSPAAASCSSLACVRHVGDGLNRPRAAAVLQQVSAFPDGCQHLAWPGGTGSGRLFARPPAAGGAGCGVFPDPEAAGGAGSSVPARPRRRASPATARSRRSNSPSPRRRSKPARSDGSRTWRRPSLPRSTTNCRGLSPHSAIAALQAGPGGSRRPPANARGPQPPPSPEARRLASRRAASRTARPLSMSRKTSMTVPARAG